MTQQQDVPEPPALPRGTITLGVLIGATLTGAVTSSHREVTWVGGSTTGSGHSAGTHLRTAPPFAFSQSGSVVKLHGHIGGRQVGDVGPGGDLMADYFEIDFLTVGETQSGDAIAVRYELNGGTYVHVVDGGFQDDGPRVMRHLRDYYGGHSVSHVVVTHPDGDHTGGLQTVLEECQMDPGGGLWMHRPWVYAAELLPSFSQFTTVDGLERALREAYPSLVALEEIAEQRGIPIYEPFQGAAIGAFTVLAPTKSRFLDLVVRSKKTPKEAADGARLQLLEMLQAAATGVIELIRAAWGDERFSPEATSAENEMSVVQYANLCGQRILLTGDVGREGLTEAADFAPAAGLLLPGVDRFDVPHHGSRRNVSTDLLDRWFGRGLPQQLPKGDGLFSAFISANPNDDDHPRKAVVRGLIHRGADIAQTTGRRGQWLRTAGGDAPIRTNGVPAPILNYPQDQED